jgi:hypothetical protein
LNDVSDIYRVNQRLFLKHNGKGVEAKAAGVHLWGGGTGGK